ncbi:MAG: FAD-dependent oxidoreductase [Candidatus Aenigmatarchaeota archaeon]
MYDSIIIGAGPAGISAAIYLKRRGLNFLIISENIGGELNFIGDIKNYPGFTNIKGIDLVKKFKEHLESYNIEVILEEVIELKKVPNGFNVITNRNIYQAKTIIVSSGAKPKKINVPGEAEYLHKGISYCSICDMPLFKDKIVAIIGGGNSGVTAGLMASQIARKVYLLTKDKELTCEKILEDEIKSKNNVEIIKEAIIKNFYGDKFLRGIVYYTKNKEVDLRVDGVFIHIGLVPSSSFIPNEWKIKNERDEIIVDKYCKSNIDGLFAAGDITDLPYNQIGIAVGQGIISALSAIDYINRLK